MARARIPKRYNIPSASLSNCGIAGAGVKTWMESPEFESDLRAGNGRTIVGTEEEADDLFALMARGCVLKGKAVNFTNVERLFRGGEDGEPMRDILTSDALLFIQGFYTPDYPTAYTDAERYRIGWLIMDRLDVGLATFFRVPVPLEKCSISQGGWWSRPLLKLISKSSPEIML